MAETYGNGGQVPTPTPPPVHLIGLSTPRHPRSYDEPDQERLLVEVRNLLSELKRETARLASKVDHTELKINSAEKILTEVKEVLAQLAPKLDDAAAFAKHRAPLLVDKSDLVKTAAELKEEILKRPTRRQAIIDFVWLFSLITAAVTFGSRGLR